MLPLERAARAGLSGTALKTIALILMVMDHIHYFFGFTGMIPEWFSMLARLSAPLFLFCTVEGFAHTHDRRRYFLRIYAIAAAMGALEFFMMYGGLWGRGDGFFPENAIFMDFAVLCVVWQGIDWLRSRRIALGLAVIALVLAWPILAGMIIRAFPASVNVVALLCQSLLPAWSFITDGGWSYLLGGVLLYLLRGRRGVQLTVWAVWTFLADFVRIFLLLRGTAGFAPVQMFTTYYEWYGVFAVLLMALYNGRRGAGHKALFYWFYPAHVYLLYGASCILYNLMR